MKEEKDCTIGKVDCTQQTALCSAQVLIGRVHLAKSTSIFVKTVVHYFRDRIRDDYFEIWIPFFKMLVGRVSDPDPYPDPHGSALI